MKLENNTSIEIDNMIFIILDSVKIPLSLLGIPITLEHGCLQFVMFMDNNKEVNMYIY